MTLTHYEEKFDFDIEQGAVIAKCSEKDLRRCIIYKIQDLAYWDAIVAFNPIKNRVMAVYSQVIGLAEATRLVKLLRAEQNQIPF